MRPGLLFPDDMKSLGIVFPVLLLFSAESRADVPSPLPGGIPAVITLSPGPILSNNPIGRYTVWIGDALNNPVQGARVEVEISPEADALVAWCSGQTHPLQVLFTDANGYARFEFLGGGCVLPEDIPAAAYVAEVRVDGVAKAHPYIVSPDVVNYLGQRAIQSGGACEANASQVTLSDAAYHTGPIMSAAASPCTKFTPPYNATVSVSDAVFLVPYIKAGSLCSCN